MKLGLKPKTKLNLTYLDEETGPIACECETRTEKFVDGEKGSRGLVGGSEYYIGNPERWSGGCWQMNLPGCSLPGALLT